MEAKNAKDSKENMGFSSQWDSRFLIHDLFITGCVIRVTRRVPHVEHELLTLPEHLSF